MRRHRWIKWTACGVLVLVGLALSTAAYAQGCALCYNVASAAKAGAIKALRSGILVLLFTPLVICAGVLVLGIRARNKFNEPEAWSSEHDCEWNAMLGGLEAEGPEAPAASGAESSVSFRAERGIWLREQDCSE